MTSAIETPSVPAMVQPKKPQATTKGRKGFKGRVDMPRTWLAFMDTAFEESQFDAALDCFENMTNSIHIPPATHVRQLIALSLDPSACTSDKKTFIDSSDPFSPTTYSISSRARTTFLNCVGTSGADSVLRAIPGYQSEDDMVLENLCINSTVSTNNGTLTARELRDRTSLDEDASKGGRNSWDGGGAKGLRKSSRDDDDFPDSMVVLAAKRIEDCQDIWDILGGAAKVEPRLPSADSPIMEEAWDLLGVLVETWEKDETESKPGKPNSNRPWSPHLLRQFQKPESGPRTSITKALDVVFRPFRVDRPSASEDDPDGTMWQIENDARRDIAIRLLALLANLAMAGRLNAMDFARAVMMNASDLGDGDAMRDFINCLTELFPASNLLIVIRILTLYMESKSNLVPQPIPPPDQMQAQTSPSSRPSPSKKPAATRPESKLSSAKVVIDLCDDTAPSAAPLSSTPGIKKEIIDISSSSPHPGAANNGVKKWPAHVIDLDADDLKGKKSDEVISISSSSSGSSTGSSVVLIGSKGPSSPPRHLNKPDPTAPTSTPQRKAFGAFLSPVKTPKTQLNMLESAFGGTGTGTSPRRSPARKLGRTSSGSFSSLPGGIGVGVGGSEMSSPRSQPISESAPAIDGFSIYPPTGSLYNWLNRTPNEFKDLDKEDTSSAAAGSITTSVSESKQRAGTATGRARPPPAGVVRRRNELKSALRAELKIMNVRICLLRCLMAYGCERGEEREWRRIVEDGEVERVMGVGMRILEGSSTVKETMSQLKDGGSEVWDELKVVWDLVRRELDGFKGGSTT